MKPEFSAYLPINVCFNFPLPFFQAIKFYFYAMSAKKLILLAKILLLFLLTSNPAAAKTAIHNNDVSGKEALCKSGHSFHQNMLQPQTVHFSIANEHQLKPVSLGYAALFLQEQLSFAVNPRSKTTTILQDTNRCESVSRLLFPFHNFW